MKTVNSRQSADQTFGCHCSQLHSDRLFNPGLQAFSTPDPLNSQRSPLAPYLLRAISH
ncbi:MAG: hypothetical protein LM550_05330 [Candidatus Contendobacter sp.]|nr:hypothetical protein [Candidatus Contendobacter sp.]